MAGMLQAATAAMLLATSVLSATPQQKTPPRKAQVRVNPNAATLAEFTRRIDQYVEVHKKLEDSLPKLPAQTDPYQIDRHQRALARLIQEGRKTAKQGDVFTPAMQQLVRNLLKPIFSGPDGRQIRAELFDNEYRGNVQLAVNARYPDEVPLSTVPPQVLAQLPKLPEELEYRFVLTNMILFDPHAHTIADFVPRAFQ